MKSRYCGISLVNHTGSIARVYLDGFPGELKLLNLDAFNDILYGGFGTPEEGFVLMSVAKDTPPIKTLELTINSLSFMGRSGCLCDGLRAIKIRASSLTPGGNRRSV
jgi:hypothetical protein